MANTMDSLVNEPKSHGDMVYKLLEEVCEELKPFELYHLYQILTVPEKSYPAKRI